MHSDTNILQFGALRNDPYFIPAINAFNPTCAISLKSNFYCFGNFSLPSTLCMDLAHTTTTLYV